MIENDLPKLSQSPSTINISNAFSELGVDPSRSENWIEALPFSDRDTTAGAESEMHSLVLGSKDDVDLPSILQQSNFFENILKRSIAGETSYKRIGDLNRFLEANGENVWDNSWVRIDRQCLSGYSWSVFRKDLLKDKGHPDLGLRDDWKSFYCDEGAEEQIRIPISYLLKLSLADVLGDIENLPGSINHLGQRLLNHFLNDNTSPEIHSFYVCRLSSESGNGMAIARETSKRFLMTQLLVMYANNKFGLKKSGQTVRVFYSPLPPQRQRNLNEIIPDSFYRELYMSPCLSGWDKGEDKHAYMELCHEVLSRSQLNALSKLKEAGIITRNLVVLPNTSNVSLANNGTHLSLGSLKLSQALKSPNKDFNQLHEKQIGDLAIKVMEHFLPLFVGTYSAAPNRMEFFNFHPETALGFLPHELHFTHLRMIWRRWRKKAKLKVFNRPITPFGPIWLDNIVNQVFSFKGDYLPDYRLVDYMVSLLGTETCSALNGELGNVEALQKELMQMGVFDKRMSLYQFIKLRSFGNMGYSGFEGRHYSLFYNLLDDFSQAANLQHLLSLFALKLIAQGRITHQHIPDKPFWESERRQMVFGCALGIPTFFVQLHSQNEFLKWILKRVNNCRVSKRYTDSVRVYSNEYQLGLLKVLKEEASDLIEHLNMETTIWDLEMRLKEPDICSSFGQISNAILLEGGKTSAFDFSSDDFNMTAERYYRTRLRTKHLRESYDLLKTNLAKKLEQGQLPQEITPEFAQGISPTRVIEYLDSLGSPLMREKVDVPDLKNLIHLVLIDTYLEQITQNKNMELSNQTQASSKSALIS